MPKWSSEQSQISPKPESILSETLTTLEPFKEIFELLKTDQLLVSVAIPSILSLIKLFDQKPRSELSSLLLEQLRNYFKKINSNPLFRAATFLDPRYVNMLLFNPFLSLDESWSPAGAYFVKFAVFGRLKVCHHFILLLTVMYKFRFKLVWCKDKDEELKVVSELRSFCALNLDGQEKEK